MKTRGYIIGFMVGVGLTFAIQAGASTLLGTTIDAVIQVEVDGENLGQAPVIDGTSYLPVRKLGNAAGYDVTFGEGKASLTSNETAPLVSPEPTPTPEPTPAPTPVDVGSYTLETVNEAIEMTTINIEELEGDIKSSESRGYEENTKALKERLIQRKTQLENLQEIKAKLATP